LKFADSNFIAERYFSPEIKIYTVQIYKEAKMYDKING